MKHHDYDTPVGCGAGCIIAIVVMWVLAVLGALQIIGSLGGMLQ